MAAEAEAAREARAKVFGAFIYCLDICHVICSVIYHVIYHVIYEVIAAQGEQKASKSLAEASQVMAQSSAALQLRYLQVRETEKIYPGISAFTQYFRTFAPSATS
jgi:hypothetical protein